jgi:hypothetical protein
MVAAREGEEGSNQEIVVSRFKVEPVGHPWAPATPLTFSFSIDIQKNYWNVFIQLGIATPEGLHLVLDSVNSDQWPELKSKGRYDVEIKMPPLWLRPMIYSSRIKVIAHPENGPTERFYSEWIDIAIEGHKQIESIADRVLVPRSDWRIGLKK